VISRALLPALVAMALAVAGPTPALAQYDEDDQTRDHEDVDGSYLERYRQQEEETPEANAEEDVEAFLARAERLIRDRNYRSASSERYRVQTDDPRLDTRAAVALLDAFRDYFDAFWRGRMELAPYDEQSRVFLFYSFHKFNQAIEGDFRYRTYRPTGHYRSLFDAITLHTDADGPGNLENALIHEAAHQLTDQRLYAGEFAPSRWVSEGLAQYFGYTRADESGSFRRGEVGGKSAKLLRGVRGSSSELRGKLRSARTTFKKAGSEAGTLVDRVISIRDPERFYGEEAPLNYGVSWLLVHFLLEGEEGARVDGFVRYLELEKQGRGGSDAFYREIGLGPEELGSALSAHLKRLDVR
jgi:hypothetical protein